jgi:membrane fusion protein, heavy metal efflux system
MTIQRAFVFSICAACCVALAACGRGSDDAARPAASTEAAAPNAQRSEVRDAGVVTVDDAMLRDLRVTTAPAEQRSGDEMLTLLGELEVDQRRYAEVGAPVAARVTRLTAQLGERVAAGQTLAELSSPDLGRARADYLSARARLTLAESALERKRGLAREKIVPLREVQEAESAVAELHASLRSAGAAIGAFGVELPSELSDTPDGAVASSFSLRSPVAGLVIERTAVLGRMLDPATAAFRIGDLSTLWLTVHAFERDAVRIQNGVRARLVFPALPGQDFEGSVTLVGRQVDPESRTIPVRIDVRNAGGTLRPGMSASAVLPVGSGLGRTVVSVPVAAVQRVRNEWSVFLPKDPRTFEIRRIGRGRDLGGEVEVLSGLTAGETVVVDGAFLLKAQAEQAEAGHEDH